MRTAPISPALALEQLASLPGLLVRAEAQAVDADAFDGLDVAGKAVLVHTGWDRHWRTDAYGKGHPFLTEAAARLLAERGAGWSASTATISTTPAAAPARSTPSCSARTS